jgi:hypothetical protein
MRQALIGSAQALRERMAQPAQVAVTAPEAALPPYLESFLAHLRLLVGVPFDYLVPDARLLPDESIRFFYIDRSWTDRLVDGVISVGKMGSREQAHHQAHSAAVNQRLDGTERYVRDLQRAAKRWEDTVNAPRDAAGVVTGFLLRSAAVSGWPHMDVRAFSTELPEPVDLAAAAKVQLKTLRLERLSPSVLIALFDGVPQLVWCEEPHHGVQFGVKTNPNGTYGITRRTTTGVGEGEKPLLGVPFRDNDRRVVHVSELRRRLATIAPPDPTMPAQTGSASFAIEVLDVPWRQRFQGNGAIPDLTGTGVFHSSFSVAALATQESTRATVVTLLKNQENLR